MIRKNYGVEQIQNRKRGGSYLATSPRGDVL